MIFDFMQNHCSLFPVQKMAEVFSVSRAGYYKYINKKEPLRVKQNNDLITKIRLIHKQNRHIYGSPRIHAQLIKQGDKCSRKRVALLMKKNTIQARSRRKWNTPKKSFLDEAKIAPNLVNQNFNVSTINRVWTSDITLINTGEGWLYVATVMDLYSRKIVGLSMGDNPNTSLVRKALDQAICHRSPQSGLIIHSDRGTQYTSNEYKVATQLYGVVLSMSATGNCYDNAAMESFFHTLKTEHVYFCKYKTRKEAAISIFEYIEVFYNRKRSHSTLGYCSPQEYEQQNHVKIGAVG